MLKYWSTPKRILSVEALSILIKFVSILNYSSMGWFFCILNDFSRGWWKSSFLSHWSLFRHQEGKYYSMTSNPAQPELSLICQRILYQSDNFQLGGKPFRSRPRPSCRRMCCWGFIHIPFHISLISHFSICYIQYSCQNQQLFFLINIIKPTILDLVETCLFQGSSSDLAEHTCNTNPSSGSCDFQDCQSKLCQYPPFPPQIF